NIEETILYPGVTRDKYTILMYNKFKCSMILKEQVVNIETLYILLIVLALMILISAGIKINEIYKTRKSVKTLCDRKVSFQEDKDVFVHYHNYFVNILENEDTDDRNIVDDETWSDLDLGQLIDKINFTFTTIGDEMLYASMRNSTEHKVID